MYVSMFAGDRGFIIEVDENDHGGDVSFYKDSFKLLDEIWIHNTTLGPILSKINHVPYVNIGSFSFMKKSFSLSEAIKWVIESMFEEHE